MKRALALLVLCCSIAQGAYAFTPSSQPVAAQGTLEAAFAPWDDIEGLIIDALGEARQQILVQAYMLTSKPIVSALIEAHRRGVDVRVLVDGAGLNTTGRARVAALHAAGIVVRLETKYKSAHNKVIVIDASSSQATVMTGSYNFTWNAQHKNAENMLIARQNPVLAEQYAANWARHSQDAQTYP